MGLFFSAADDLYSYLEGSWRPSRLEARGRVLAVPAALLSTGGHGLDLGVAIAGT